MWTKMTNFENQFQWTERTPAGSRVGKGEFHP
jgi:hypothetical protein